MFPEVNGVMEYFLKHPLESIHLRELARRTQFSPAGARKILKKLTRQKLLLEQKVGNLLQYKANTDSPDWLPIKRAYNIFALHKSGLAEALIAAYEDPQAVIVFGSYARGEDTEKSDIDIAVISTKEVEVNLAKYEKVLARKINIMAIDMKETKREFKNNLANGVVLHGYVTLI